MAKIGFTKLLFSGIRALKESQVLHVSMENKILFGLFYTAG